MGHVLCSLNLGEFEMSRGLHSPGSSPVTVSQVCSSTDLQFLPRVNFKMDLYTSNCPTGWVLQLLVGCHCQRWQKGCPRAAALFPVPSHEQHCSKAPLQHLHLPHPRTSSGFSHPGWANSEIVLLPSPQTHLCWDREAAAGCTTRSSNCAICFYWHTQVSKHCHRGLGSFR